MTIIYGYCSNEKSFLGTDDKCTSGIRSSKVLKIGKKFFAIYGLNYTDALLSEIAFHFEQHGFELPSDPNKLLTYIRNHFDLALKQYAEQVVDKKIYENPCSCLLLDSDENKLYDFKIGKITYEDKIHTWMNPAEELAQDTIHYRGVSVAGEKQTIESGPLFEKNNLISKENLRDIVQEQIDFDKKRLNGKIDESVGESGSAVFLSNNECEIISFYNSKDDLLFDIKSNE